jgi:putative ABC transport system permease protein
MRNYILSSIKHGGQRMIVAVLAVAFGVMALIAMSTLSNSIETAISGPSAREGMGGDVAASLPAGYLSPDALTPVEQMADEGLIEAYTVETLTFSPIIRTTDSGRATFVQRGVGIEPNTYPLVGSFTYQDDAQQTTGQRLDETGSALITKDVAARYDLAMGDSFRLSQPSGSALPVDMTVTGIIADNPSHQGRTIYYNVATSQALAGQQAAISEVLIITEQPEAVTARLAEAGWETRTVDDIPQPSSQGGQALFNFLLKGAGVLGLLVGGIGIANTMQVLLAQRTREVAILKTLGYSQGQLRGMFVAEAALLGIVGSILGALLALGLSRTLLRLFENTSTLLLTAEGNPMLLVGGVAVGVVTTVLFALYAIVRTTQVRPAVLFRQQRVEQGTVHWLRAVGFYALIALPMAAISSLVLGNVLQGVGILIVALVGLLVLGGILWGATWVITRFMPTFNAHLLDMARTNLRARGMGLVFALIALFVGIYTLGFGATAVQASLEQNQIRTDTTEQYNMVVYVEDESRAVDAMQQAGVNDINRRYEASITSIMMGGERALQWTSELQARPTAWDITIEEGPALGASTGGVYVLDGLGVPVGSVLDVTLADGTSTSLEVIGTYRAREFESSLVNTGNVLVTDEETFGEVASGTSRTILFGSVPPADLIAVTEAIGQALPESLVLNTQDLNAAIVRDFRNFFVFGLAMSGLALLAGMMLIANVVSLELINRRYEIGLMKAVGYTRQHVLTTIGLEYGLVAAIASGLALAAVQLTIVGVTLINQTAADIFFINGWTVAIIMLAGIGLTLATALGAAWRPTQVRPLAVLNRA